jgi:Rieske Fe-S protein
VRHGLSKLAVYRDEAGEIHACSAVCTHMKCIVAWNSTEKSWDCGCHGSRFDVDGRVLNGPAVEALEKVEAPVK